MRAYAIVWVMPSIQAQSYGLPRRLTHVLHGMSRSICAILWSVTTGLVFLMSSILRTFLRVNQKSRHLYNVPIVEVIISRVWLSFALAILTSHDVIQSLHNDCKQRKQHD